MTNNTPEKKVVGPIFSILNTVTIALVVIFPFFVNGLCY